MDSTLQKLIDAGAKRFTLEVLKSGAVIALIPIGDRKHMYRGDTLEEAVLGALEQNDEIPPCQSCAANDLPNCGMAHCVTRRK